jgi:hypothetical protein
MPQQTRQQCCSSVTQCTNCKHHICFVTLRVNNFSGMRGTCSQFTHLSQYC